MRSPILDVDPSLCLPPEQQQAAGLVFRTRDLLVRQRTQLINAIRGHLTEFGWIAPKGPSHVAMLAGLIEEEEMASSLPEAARAMLRLMLDLLADLDGKIAEACGGAHHWARQLSQLGHEVRLIPPAYVKPLYCNRSRRPKVSMIYDIRGRHGLRKRELAALRCHNVLHFGRTAHE